MLMIHTVSTPPLAGIRVTPCEMRGVTVKDFIARAHARGYTVAQHRAAFYLLRLH